jgi:hypothetical protein
MIQAWSNQGPWVVHDVVDARPPVDADVADRRRARESGAATPSHDVGDLALHAQRGAGNALFSRVMQQRTSAPRGCVELSRCPDGSDPGCPCGDDELDPDNEAEQALARAVKARRIARHTDEAVMARLGTGVDVPAPEPASQTGEPSPTGGHAAHDSAGATGCLFPIDDVTLFEQLRRTWPLFGHSSEYPIWTGTVDLGWLGCVEISVLAGADAEASLLTSLGAGLIRDICLDGDPASACVTGTGTLAIPAEAAPEVLLGGSLRGSANYLGRVPLAALAGDLQAAAGANASPAVAVSVTVTYEEGKLSFAATAELSMALQLSFDLIASLLAELFGDEVWSTNWQLVSWRWERLWNIIGKLTVGMSGGVASEPQLELIADQISLEEVVRAMFADLIDADEIIGGIRGSSAAGEIEMLDPMAAVIAGFDRSSGLCGGARRRRPLAAAGHVAMHDPVRRWRRPRRRSHRSHVRRVQRSRGADHGGHLHAGVHQRAVARVERDARVPARLAVPAGP